MMVFSIIILTSTVVSMVIGSQMPVQALSGHCEVKGDPHIHAYDTHSITSGTHSKLEEHYNTGFYTGQFVLTRNWLKEKPATGAFYADANFISRPSNTNVTYASQFTYREPGIAVELILPINIFTDSDKHCRYSDSANHRCATKILVNGTERSIVENGSPVEFQGTDGTVLIFKYGECNVDYYDAICTILIVGTKGLVLRLDVEPWSNEYYNFFIYPAQRLQNKLYGLCDTFTGELTRGYTKQDGAVITNVADMDTFVYSWRVGWPLGDIEVTDTEDGCSCHYVPFAFGCVVRDPAPDNKACYCWVPTAAVHCDAKVVDDCIRPSEKSCTKPDASLASCLQARGGNCDGY